MLERIRRLLTLGYVGILALILVLFGAIVTLVFSNQLSRQQDAQLVQEAESVARRVRNHVPIGTQAPTKTENPGEGGELGHGAPDAAHHLDPDAVTAVVTFIVPPENPPAGAGKTSIYGVVPDPSFPYSSLGLPAREEAREAEQEVVPGAETIDGPQGEVRVVSVPLGGSPAA
jgi:hypothetical protein